MKKLLLVILIFSITIAQNNTKISIYNQYALINETINVKLNEGKNEINYYNIPSNINLDFIYLSLSAKILSQSIITPVFNLGKLLENQDVDLIHKDGSLISGKIIKIEQNSAVISTQNNLITILPNINDYQIKTKLQYDEKKYKPFLKWEVEGKKGDYDANLTYKVNGISWNADYMLIINKDKANIKSFYTINNTTDVSYKDVFVKFISGEIKNNYGMPKFGRAMNTMAVESAPYDQTSIQQDNLDEFKIYTYNKKIDLPPYSSKQYEYFSVENIELNKVLYYETSHFNELSKEKPFVQYQISNTKNNKMGFVLPAGNVKTYQVINDELIFTGEDLIKDLSADEMMKVNIGKAYDVAISQKISSMQQISDKVRVVETTITINNYSNEEKNLVLVDNLYGSYDVIEASEKYENLSAGKVQFKIKLKANSEKILKFKVRFNNSY